MEVLRLKISAGNVAFEAEGHPDVVRELYGEVRDHILGYEGAPVPPVEGVPSEASAGHSGPEAQEHSETPELDADARRMPARAFVEGFDFKNNRQRAAAIALWLMRNKGKSAVTPEEIDQTWKSTKMKAPGDNLRRDINQAVDDGLLTQGDESGTYWVPGWGEGRLNERRSGG